jgi:site-specific DNA-cytosine methylase
MRRLYLIELFARTHSVSNAVKRSGIARDHDFRVLSVDIDTKFQPSVVADISTWRFKSPIDNFLKDGRASDIVAVHASPPCTEFSRALTTRPRDLKAGSRNVKAALRIIRHVDPDFWIVENPVGLLKDQSFMQRGYAKYLNTTCYCKFGFPYRKATNIWSNIPQLELPMCDSQTPCKAKRELGRHVLTAQAGPSSTTPGSGGGENVYGLPPKLVQYLFRCGIAASRR